MESTWKRFNINKDCWIIHIIGFSGTGIVLLGVTKDCEFSSLLMSVSTLFVAVIFDIVEG